MSFIIRKIWHLYAHKIGFFFDFKSDIKTELKKLIAKYSLTHECCNLDYNYYAYSQLKSEFSDINIDKNTTSQTFRLPTTTSVTIHP